MIRITKHRALMAARQVIPPLGSWILIAATTASCSNTEFGSNSAANSRGANLNPNGDKPPQQQQLQPYGTPASLSLPEPGWVAQEVQSDLETMLKSMIQLDGSGIDTDTGKGGDDESTDHDTGISANTDGVLWLPCNPGESGAGAFPSDFYGYKETQIQVSGEFCPSPSLTGSVSVLFVIDHSGSMEGSASEGPNDPTTQGSCGRLRAAEALMKKYATMNDADVEASVVGFSDQARVQLPFADLAATQAQLNASIFCGSDSNRARTNYEAAFDTAYTQLTNRSGTKVVYFISDGSPTAGRGDPRQSGLASATRLRGLTDVSLYALFVGYKSGNANNPQGYLELITGDPKKVRITANADELANAATTLGQGDVKIEAADVLASLDVKGNTSTIALERFGLRSTNKTHYIWLTKPIELTGDAQEAILNQLTVTAKTSEGKDLTTVAKILFHQFAP